MFAAGQFFFKCLKKKKEISNAHQCCIYWIKNTINSNIVEYDYNLK